MKGRNFLSAGSWIGGLLKEERDTFLEIYCLPSSPKCGEQNYIWQYIMTENNSFHRIENISKVRIVHFGRSVDFNFFRNFILTTKYFPHLTSRPTSQYTNFKLLKLFNIFRIFCSICYIVVCNNK